MRIIEISKFYFSFLGYQKALNFKIPKISKEMNKWPLKVTGQKKYMNCLWRRAPLSFKAS